MSKSPTILSSKRAVEVPSCGTSDYGFAGSWDYSGPLPSSPGDVAARVMAAAREIQGSGTTSGTDGEGEHGSSRIPASHSSPMPNMSEFAVPRRVTHPSPLASESPSADGSSVCMESEDETHNESFGGIGEGYNRVGLDECAGRADKDSTSISRDQVSLPEDIYGAARVSEYWHGMTALSSLASAYVYDDIWAGNGGLTTREDILGVSLSTTGGVAADVQKQGGGGEAVTEGVQMSNPGGEESIVALPRSWSRGELGGDLRQDQSKVWKRASQVPGADGAKRGTENSDTTSAPSREKQGSRRRCAPSSHSERECVDDGDLRWSSSMDSDLGTVRRRARCMEGDSVGEVKCAKRVASPSPNRDSLTQATAEAYCLSGAPNLGEHCMDGGNGRDMNAGGGRSTAVASSPTCSGNSCQDAASSKLRPALDTSPTTAVNVPDEENFFADHVLEQKPRLDWGRGVLLEGETEGTPPGIVAHGIAKHRLAHGIGSPGWSKRVHINPLPSRNSSSAWAGNCSRPVPSLTRCSQGDKDTKSDDGGNDGNDDQSTVPLSAVERSATPAGDSSFEWEVRPEAMVAYFTSIIDLVPSALSTEEAAGAPVAVGSSSGDSGGNQRCSRKDAAEFPGASARGAVEECSSWGW